MSSPYGEDVAAESAPCFRLLTDCVRGSRCVRGAAWVMASPAGEGALGVCDARTAVFRGAATNDYPQRTFVSHPAPAGCEIRRSPSTPEPEPCIVRGRSGRQSRFTAPNAPYRESPRETEIHGDLARSHLPPRCDVRREWNELRTVQRRSGARRALPVRRSWKGDTGRPRRRGRVR